MDPESSSESTSGTTEMPTGPRLSGVFAVHKPVGWTSADVVRKIRGVICTELKRRGTQVTRRSIKLGHGGTLDCRAAGVLVLGLGRGTKQLHDLSATQKRYIAEGQLGKATDTYDTDGKITEEKPFDHVTEDTFRQTMDTFRGEQMQVAPIYSALKVAGERLSDRARRGEAVKPKPPRPVVVHSLELLSFNPPHFQLGKVDSTLMRGRLTGMMTGQKVRQKEWGELDSRADSMWESPVEQAFM
ncbi:pseudouridylate synthase TRUB1-like isoform X2 [Branchiostoma floridae x Branchiostoma belcheri]